MAVIYAVRAGAMVNAGVDYEIVVAFTTRREAETVVAEVKREDPYVHQYDDVLPIRVYATRAQWNNGIRQRAKMALKKARAAKSAKTE